MDDKNLSENMQKNLDEIGKRLDIIEAKPGMPDHRHNGFDVSRVLWGDVAGKKLYIHHTIQGTAAATATNYGTFWIAPFACYVSAFSETHQTAGTDGGSVTLQLEKLPSGVAPDSGSALLTTAINLKGTINTVLIGALLSPQTSLKLATGDRLCMKDAGVLTAVANVTVIVEITTA